MFNNNPTDDNEYIFAALAYFPFVSLFLIFTLARKQYYIKYHAAHAIIVYLISFFILISGISTYVLIRGFFNDAFNLDMMFGLFFSVHLVSTFCINFYFSIKAFQGNYIIIPLITKVFYALFR